MKFRKEAINYNKNHEKYKFAKVRVRAGYGLTEIVNIQVDLRQ